MKKITKLVAVVKVSWWVRPYLFGVVVTSRLTNREPNWKKVEDKVLKGLKTIVKTVEHKPKDSLRA